MCVCIHRQVAQRYLCSQRIYILQGMWLPCSHGSTFNSHYRLTGATEQGSTSQQSKKGDTINIKIWGFILGVSLAISPHVAPQLHFTSLISLSSLTHPLLSFSVPPHSLLEHLLKTLTFFILFGSTIQFATVLTLQICIRPTFAYANPSRCSAK